VTTVTATDLDGTLNPITYSIIGGNDQSLFTINSSTGALAFVSGRDFETPTDNGTNNIYNVTVQASDGTNTDTQAIAVTVTNASDSISIANATATEGNDLSFVVTLSGTSTNTVTVNYATANSTAGSLDYTAASGVVTFAPGVTSQTITIHTANDSRSELSEAVIVNLSNAVNGNIIDGKGVGTITDNDTPGAFAITTSVSAGGTTGTAFDLNSLEYIRSNDPEIDNPSTRPSATVSATTTSGEFDTYKLDVTVSGTVVSFDIDHGATSGSTGFDPWVRILDASQGLVAQNDDRGSTDAGSLVSRDSLVSATLSAGTYYIQVGQWNGNSGNPAIVVNNGSFGYEMQVSILPPTVTDPVVLDLNHDGISFSSLEHGVSFDINGDGLQDQVAWTSNGHDGILAMDVNHSGKIEGGNELFTPTFNGGHFADGIAALASLDGNHDGVIDSKDQAFGQLVVWQDNNHNGVSDSGELTHLVDLGITSIGLATTPGAPIDGQNIPGVGTFTYADGTTGTFVEADLDSALGDVPAQPSTQTAEATPAAEGKQPADASHPAETAPPAQPSTQADTSHPPEGSQPADAAHPAQAAEVHEAPISAAAAAEITVEFDHGGGNIDLSALAPAGGDHAPPSQPAGGEVHASVDTAVPAAITLMHEQAALAMQLAAS
jgi:hypothetical protein